MWQLYVLFALTLDSVEHVVDKVAMVKDRAIDTLIASFHRTSLYFAFSTLLGLLGVFGPLRFYFGWQTIVVTVLWMVGTYAYSHLLKKIEVTGSSILSYITPSVFLFVDVFCLNAHLSPAQAIGIFLLMLGGILFVIDDRRLAIKKEYTRYIWGIFLFNCLLYGAEFYSFQYLHVHEDLNEVSYIFSIWSLVALGLLIMIVARGKISQLLHSYVINRPYLLKVSLSKSIDAMTSIFWFKAATLASVSQINAFGSFSPVILFIVVYVAQEIFGFHAEEGFQKSALRRKVPALLLLCLGGWLAS